MNLQKIAEERIVTLDTVVREKTDELIEMERDRRNLLNLVQELKVKTLGSNDCFVCRL